MGFSFENDFSALDLTEIVKMIQRAIKTLRKELKAFFVISNDY